MSSFAGDITSVAIGAITIFFVALMFAIEFAQESALEKTRIAFHASLKYQFAATVVLFEAIMLFGSFRSSAFVYFQF